MHMSVVGGKISLRPMGLAVNSLLLLFAWGYEASQSQAKWDCVTSTMMSFGMPCAVA
jgi:hypothetical protein